MDMKCLTPANSLASLEKAKLCNTLMHKIKTHQSKKVVFRNPAEPNDYETTVSTIEPHSVVDVEQDTTIENEDVREEFMRNFHEKNEHGSYYELDVNKLTNDIRVAKINLEKNLLEGDSLEQSTIKNYLDEEKSEDDVSIIRAHEVVARYKDHKARTGKRRSGQRNLSNSNQQNDDLQNYLYYSMLALLLLTFCLIMVFL